MRSSDEFQEGGKAELKRHPDLRSDIDEPHRVFDDTGVRNPGQNLQEELSQAELVIQTGTEQSAQQKRSTGTAGNRGEGCRIHLHWSRGAAPELAHRAAPHHGDEQ